MSIMSSKPYSGNIGAGLGVDKGGIERCLCWLKGSDRLGGEGEREREKRTLER